MKNRNLNNHDNWETPRWLYEELDSTYKFDFDPCPINPTFDGLTIEWGQRNFVNPPYSRKLKEAFVEKALQESKKEKLCVLLLPVSTSTKLFHEVIRPNAIRIQFLRGRLKFIGYDTKGKLVLDKTGMHDSMLVVFEGR